MIRALVLIIAPLAVLAYACGDGGSTQSPSATSAPSATPTPSEWTTYVDPRGLFSIDFPAHWYRDEYGAQFFSYDPRRTIGPPGLPPEIVKVEVGYHEARGSSSCGGAQATDPITGKSLGPLPIATATSLDGQPAYEIRHGKDDPNTEGGTTLIRGVSAVYSGYCVLVGAYYTQTHPDEATFEKMLATFRFLPNPSPT